MGRVHTRAMTTRGLATNPMGRGHQPVGLYHCPAWYGVPYQALLLYNEARLGGHSQPSYLTWTAVPSTPALHWLHA